MQNIITDKMKLKAESFILEYRGKTAERSESQTLRFSKSNTSITYMY